MHQRKNRGICADAKRQRQDGGYRDPAVVDQRSNTEAKILIDSMHPLVLRLE